MDEQDKLRDALEEAKRALNWIWENTADLPADFPNQGVRLRQVADRANEAIRDIDQIVRDGR